MAIIIPLAISCSGQHLINDTGYRRLVDSAFIERQDLAANRAKELFSVFNRSLSDRQTEALKFLFAFMPLSDLADYTGEFFLANVDISLRALDESPWGKDIPEELFLHYVLPCRVNNENLDSFRIVCFDEIMNRVKNHSIIDAALEINHWCHEKVSYQAADIRTSAPMSTILSARGRCGEESTFTVAALRTAGIPARQVYTPDGRTLMIIMHGWRYGQTVSGTTWAHASLNLSLTVAGLQSQQGGQCLFIQNRSDPR